MRKNFASVSTFVLHEGDSVRIEAPPETVWSLLFAHRVKTPGSHQTERSTVLTARSFDKRGRLVAKSIRLLEFKQGQDRSIAPGIDLQGASPVVCTVKGQGAIRLFFASESRASLDIERYGTDSKITFDARRLDVELKRIAHSKRRLGLMSLLLEQLLPGDFLHYPTLKKFDKKMLDDIANEIADIDEEELICEFLELIGFIDMRISLGERLRDGTVVLFVSALNVRPEMLDVALAICLQKRNFLVFHAMLMFLEDKAKIATVLQTPLPRTKVSDFEPLQVIFGVVAESKMTVHFHLLNLFHKISPRDELRIVFNASNIYGIENENENEVQAMEILKPSLVAGGEVMWAEELEEEEEVEEEGEKEDSVALPKEEVVEVPKQNTSRDVGLSVAILGAAVGFLCLFVRKYTIGFL